MSGQGGKGACQRTRCKAVVGDTRGCPRFGVQDTTEQQERQTDEPEETRRSMCAAAMESCRGSPTAPILPSQAARPPAGSLSTGAPSPAIPGGNAQPGWVVCIYLPW